MFKEFIESSKYYFIQIYHIIFVGRAYACTHRLLLLKRSLLLRGMFEFRVSGVFQELK